MTLDLRHLVLLGLFSASLHWLVARSEIFRVVWENAGGWFDRLLRCPACSGFWLGLGLGGIGVRPLVCPWRALAIAASGLLAVVLTPVFEGVLLWGLAASAVQVEEAPAAPPLRDDEDTTTPVDRPRSGPQRS